MNPTLFAAVSAQPASPQAWQDLTAMASRLPEAGRLQVLAQLAQLALDPPQARWLRQTALYHLSGELNHLCAVGALAALLPESGRWLTYCHWAWGHALSQTANRQGLRSVLIQTGALALIQRMGSTVATQHAVAHRSTPSRAAAHAPQRVAIYAPQLIDPAHPSTAMALDLCKLLVRAGMQVRLFSAQEFRIPGAQAFSAGPSPVQHPVDPDSWRLHSAQPLHTVCADADSPIAQRWYGLLDKIVDYQPDLVLFVGFMSPLMWALHRLYPVLGMSLHTVAPMAPVDVWLAASAEATDDRAWPGLPPPLPLAFPYRFWPEKPVDAVSRAALGVPPAALLLVSTGQRLVTEMTPDWRAAIEAFVQDNPHVHWLLVGADGHLPGQVPTGPRVHVLPSQPDLLAWLRLADVYLNPPRIGGGTSVALAMQAGVPVLALAGGDGGDKLGGDAVADLAAYMQRLTHWVQDPAARWLAGGQAQTRFAHTLDLSSGVAQQQLIQACALTMKRFAQRSQSAT